MTDPRVAFAIISVRPRLHLIRVKAFCSLLGPQISNQISLALTRFFGIRCTSRLYSVASFSTVFTAHLHPGLSGSLALAVLIAIHVRSKVAPEVGNVARILLHVALPCPLCGAMTATRTSRNFSFKQDARRLVCCLGCEIPLEPALDVHQMAVGFASADCARPKVMPLNEEGPRTWRLLL